MRAEFDPVFRNPAPLISFHQIKMPFGDLGKLFGEINNQSLFGRKHPTNPVDPV
jgi:hypothetical protein